METIAHEGSQKKRVCTRTMKTLGATCITSHIRVKNYGNLPIVHEITMLLYYSIDATKDDGSNGKLINHSRRGNLCPKVLVVDDVHNIIFTAGRDISKDEELIMESVLRQLHVLLPFPGLINEDLFKQ